MNQVFQLESDPRETAIYTVLEAASYVGVPRETLRYWLAKPAKGTAIIEAGASRKLSFYNLLEAHVLKTAKDRDVPLNRIRSAVDGLRERFPGNAHPLLATELHTAKDYRSLFLRELSGPTTKVTNISKGGQLEFEHMLLRYLKRIDRDALGMPVRLRPQHTRHIVIDHRVSGGRPVVEGTGILASVLASRAAGGQTAHELAHAYGVDLAYVKEAIRYSAA